MAEAPRTICILGGSGFLGLRLLQSIGGQKMNVKVLSRRVAERRPFPTTVEVARGDLLDAESLIRFLEPGAFVINLAYLQDRPYSDNLRAAANLAEACTKVGVRRLLHVSTAAVVGRASEDVVTEDTPCRPVTDYEKVKLEIEQSLLERLAGRCGVTVLRPTEVFGAGGAGLVRLAAQVRDASRIVGLKCALFGRRRLHLIYVDNVVAAVLFLAFADESVDGECFLVSDDEADQNTYGGVVRVLADAFGFPHVPRTGWEAPSFMLSGLLRLAGRSDTNPRRVYRCDKLLLAGFRKPVPFEDGVRRFAEWFKSGKRTAAPI
ncbi:MAG: NAD-dependent epimerase/dehydratase family protein [Burkholderiales bacterium]